MPAHPLLKPALRRAWRDLRTVQCGVAPAHALTFGPLDPATASFLALLDGTRGRVLLRAEARRLGLPDGRADAVVEQLAEAGLLDDTTGGGPSVEVLRRRGTVVDRLRADHASLTVTRPGAGAAMRALAARGTARVQVRGAGRTGAVIASLLAAAGVGLVDVRDGGRVAPWEVGPGGHGPDAVGERREDSARRAVRGARPDRAPRPRSRPRPRPRPSGGRGSPDAPDAPGAPGTPYIPGAPDAPCPSPAPEPPLALVLLTPREGVDVHAPDPGAAAELMAAGVPHLYAGVVEGTGVVGPLVLPGTTACAQCLALHQLADDPAWPRLSAQWRSGAAQRVPPCDVTLATAVAGLAAGHALAVLDGTVPASADSRWEAVLPRLAWRARSLGPHPECRCGAAARAAHAEHPSGRPATHETMAR
ncbi:ThiF family adenylyltransferase [Streptomyces sp. NPDC005955]|uniref:ThiF family adenylyltransferase n=1 Tax=Streptomyces sp. NPDC005955 TaxID=3364738 RepID=UPI00369C3970